MSILALVSITEELWISPGDVVGVTSEAIVCPQCKWKRTSGTRIYLRDGRVLTTEIGVDEVMQRLRDWTRELDEKVVHE